MSRLLVDRLRCITDTPDWIPDEVYLLVAVATTRGRAQLQLFSIAPAIWKGLGGGSAREDDVLVDADYGADNLYVAALLERDGAHDFDPSAVLFDAQQRVEEIYLSFASIDGLHSSQLAVEICKALDATIRELAKDDEVIGRAFSIPVSLSQQGQVLLCASDSRYQICFKTAA